MGCWTATQPVPSIQSTQQAIGTTSCPGEDGRASALRDGVQMSVRE